MWLPPRVSSAAARLWVMYPNSARQGDVRPATMKPVISMAMSPFRVAIPKPSNTE